MVDMIPSPFYIVFLVLAGIALLTFAYGLFTTPTRRRKPVPRGPARGKPGDKGVCPVCGLVLDNGKQIKSAVFPGEGERLMHIFGCPRCYPYAERDIERKCPVCKKTVSPEGYLIARLFERPHGKRHVHILGCVECRLPKKK